MPVGRDTAWCSNPVIQFYSVRDSWHGIQFRLVFIITSTSHQLCAVRNSDSTAGNEVSATVDNSENCRKLRDDVTKVFWQVPVIRVGAKNDTDCSPTEKPISRQRQFIDEVFTVLQ